MTTAATYSRVGDEAVRRATGHTWAEWFALLDGAGASTLRHREIVALLVERHDLGPWWLQMVTVAYEQARGLRAVHEKVDGFSVSASRTVGATVERTFAAWSDQREREAWLPEPIAIRKATPGRSLRITWIDGLSNVEVTFTARGERCQVAVQHGRLPDADAAARMRRFWREAMDRLRARLEG